ncbi:NUDIX hydrolase, partial [Patescibacteria group bacterium]|nr:NUDIX hydrolase [Patescibacteria group bacterium]
MSITPWNKLSEEIVHENPWWVYKIKKFIAHHGEEVDYHISSGRGFSLIIGVDADGKIPMVKQWRPTIERESLEFPAGCIESGQKPLQCAKEEFAQEAGLVAYNMQSLGKQSVFIGRSDSEMHIFLAYNLIQATDAKPDKNEQFEHFLLTPQKIEEKISSGEIHDS